MLDKTPQAFGPRCLLLGSNWVYNLKICFSAAMLLLFIIPIMLYVMLSMVITPLNFCQVYRFLCVTNRVLGRLSETGPLGKTLWCLKCFIWFRYLCMWSIINLTEDLLYLLYISPQNLLRPSDLRKRLDNLVLIIHLEWL